RLDAGEQLGECERLGEIVIAADLQAPDPVVHRLTGAQDQDGKAQAAAPKGLDQAEAVQAWQHDVNDSKVRPVLARKVEAGPSVTGDVHNEARLPQTLRNELRQ